MQGVRKWSFDTKKFDVIDCPSKAYWLGFIYGDGSLSKYSLSVELNQRDKQQLTSLSEFLDFTGPIKPTRKNCFRIRFNSVSFVRSLQQQGIVINKTHSSILPAIQQGLLSHFYRGILDSDGWIVKHNNKFNIPQYEYGFCSNNTTLLYDIRDYLASRLGLNTIGSLQMNRRCPSLIIGGNKKFLQLSDILYDNAFYYLERKYVLMSKAKLYILNRPDMRRKPITVLHEKKAT